MAYEIIPYEGVGPIKFGMTREEVREAVGSPVKEFFKFADDKTPADSFFNSRMQVHYDEDGRFYVVELFKKEDVLLNGQAFMNKNFLDVRKWFEKEDVKLQFDEFGLVSEKYGVGIFSPDYEYDQDAIVEGMCIFSQKYLAEEQAFLEDVK